ncbi:hypothetical protein FJ658_07365 [Schumannella sp. 10F1B-5-1]|nr:hypothetical protein FJ658_07365 [Schumannella sp. 10F1B-5-1]
MDDATITPTPNADSVGAAPVVAGDRIGSYAVRLPVDAGSREYATGAVTLDSAGRPASYTVASGDLVDYIAERFGFPDFGYLNTLNRVRRGGYPWPIYPGDTLNLSAYTVTTVGDIQGVVRNEAPPSPLPQQR